MDTKVSEAPKHKPPGPLLVAGFVLIVGAHGFLGVASLANWEGRTYPDDSLLLFSGAALYCVVGMVSRHSRTALVSLGFAVAAAELCYSVLTPSDFLGSKMLVLPLATAVFLGVMLLPVAPER